MKKLKPEDKTKLKNKLDAMLGRVANSNELTNAEKDPALLVDVLFDKIEALEARVEDLENQ